MARDDEGDGCDGWLLGSQGAQLQHQEQRRRTALAAGLFLIATLCCLAWQGGARLVAQRDALAMTNLWGPYYQSYYAAAPTYAYYPQYQYQQLAPAMPPSPQASLVAKVTAPSENIKAWGAQRVKFEVARLIKEEDLSVKAEEKMATAVGTLAQEVEQMKVQTAVAKVDGDDGRTTTQLVEGQPGPPGQAGSPGSQGSPGALGAPGAPGAVEYVPEPEYPPPQLSEYPPYGVPPPWASSRQEGRQSPEATAAPLQAHAPAPAPEQTEATKNAAVLPTPKAKSSKQELVVQSRISPNPLAGSLFAVQVPDGLTAGSEFEAEVPGHGLETVKVPNGVHSGQVIDIETTDPAKLQQKTSQKQASTPTQGAHVTVSMPPPEVPPPVKNGVKAPPPLNALQREEVRAAMGHETYQMVVDEALKVDRSADKHEAAALRTSRPLDSITVNNAAAVPATVVAPSEAPQAPVVFFSARHVHQTGMTLRRAPLTAAALRAHVSPKATTAAAHEQRLDVQHIPAALQKAALSVHKMVTEQKALESSVVQLEQVASHFMAAHARTRPVETKGTSFYTSMFMYICMHV